MTGALDPQVVFHPSVIERFARSAPGLPGVTRRTLRTSQRFIARRVVPQLHPADVPLPRERSKAPYTAAEIDGFLTLADAQPTRERRMRASGLICLGAGAGLIRADLREVRGSDVLRRAGGVIVQVAGRRNRTAEAVKYHLLTDFAAALARSASHTPPASDALPGSASVPPAVEAGEAERELTQTQPEKPGLRRATGGQAIVRSSVGGDATQIRGVKGNVRIDRGSAPVPVDATSNAADGGPPDCDAQTVTDSHVSGHLSQIDDVGGDVEMD